VDIAGSVGFADQSTFTHAFTKRFGVAPGRWRGERH
ncbi:helix-turn-helix domain-containing protein, partial [Burkholderia sp. E168m23]